MDAEKLAQMLDYNYWAHERVWNCVAKLSDEQFKQSSDYSIGSVHQQLVHVMSADWVWLNRLNGVSPDHQLNPADYPTREAIRARWAEIERDLRAHVAGLDDDQLNDPVRYHRISAPDEWRETLRWQIVLHVVNHGTDHRAQILSLIHRLGGETIAQDLIFYLDEH